MNNLAFFTHHDLVTAVAIKGVVASVGQPDLSGCSYINAKGFYLCATGQDQQATGESTNQHDHSIHRIQRLHAHHHGELPCGDPQHTSHRKREHTQDARRPHLGRGGDRHQKSAWGEERIAVISNEAMRDESGFGEDQTAVGATEAE